METVTIAASRASVLSDPELLTIGAIVIAAIVVIVIHRARMLRNRDLPTRRA
jgi:hypothetical protein